MPLYDDHHYFPGFQKQEELKRLEPREALSGVLGGAAIVAGGTAASVGMVIVLPAVAGYQKVRKE